VSLCVFRAPFTNLEQLIEKNPQEESNYISLIFLYSKNDEEKKHLKLFKIRKGYPKFRMGAGNFIQKIFGC
jgi:hypothetical protein